MRKLAALLLVCALVAMGCVGAPEKSSDWSPETGATPSPSFEAPSPSPLPSPSLTPSPSPSPTPIVSQAPSPTPSPVPSPVGDVKCSMTLQSIGDAQKRVIAEFENTNASVAYMRCKATDGWTQVELNSQKLANIDCVYSQNETAFTYVAGAKLGDAECQVNIYVPATTTSYLFTVNPSADSFTVYKNVSNTTIRYYYVNNTGTATLAQFNCTSNMAWVTQTYCPVNYTAGTGDNTSFTFNFSGVSAGTQYVVLNYGALSATNASIPVTVTIYDGTAPTPTPSPSPSPSPTPTPSPMVPSCTTVSAVPSTVNASNVNASNATVTNNYYNFTGTLSPSFDCGLGTPFVGTCGSTPDGSCTFNCDYYGRPTGTYTVGSSINGTACGGSFTVTVQN